jgi:hypothetical protein
MKYVKKYNDAHYKLKNKDNKKINYVLSNSPDMIYKSTMIGESSLEFDVEFAINKIKNKFKQEDVKRLFSDELLEWIDPDWSDKYDSEHDWYNDHNNGEIQDIIIEQIINWYVKEYGKISVNDEIKLKDRIKKEYDILKY